MTPQNKYHVYVAHETDLVEQWDFFPRVEDEEPQFSTPWSNWDRYGPILLSDGRGAGRRHTEIQVMGALSREAFTELEAPDLLPLEPLPMDH